MMLQILKKKPDKRKIYYPTLGQRVCDKDGVAGYVVQIYDYHNVVVYTDLGQIHYHCLKEDCPKYSPLYYEEDCL